MTGRFATTFLARLVAACFLMGLVVATGFGQDLSPEPPRETKPATTPEKVDVSDVVDDSRIEKRIREILLASEYFTEVDVTSKNGFVTLTGKADSGDNLEWARAIALKTEDVVGVRNKIVRQDRLDLQSAWTTVWSSLNDLWQEMLRQMPLLVLGLFVIVVTILVARIARGVCRKILSTRAFRANLIDLLVTLLNLSIWVVGLLMAAVVAFPGMTPTRALTVLGLGSVAIGFAFKDIFENFFAGLLILWRYPFDRGDVVEVEDVVGRVQSITIRNTLIRRMDGELVIVPNATMFKSNVEVLTHLPQRRIRIMCGVDYGTDLDAAREIIEQAVSSCETVESTKPVQVFANCFNDSSIDFEIAWWAGAIPYEVRRSRDEVIRAIKVALDKGGIVIPFPIRTVIVDRRSERPPLDSRD